MKRSSTILSLLAIIAFTTNAFGQLDLPRNSSKASISQTVGLTTITVEYSRPNVILNDKNRTGEIWGKLIPYELSANNFTGRAIPWRAGANENTTISFSTDVKLEGIDLPKGTYSFFVVPHENGEATLILNHDIHQWGSFSYDESKNALEVKIQTEAAPQTNLLTFDFQQVTTESCTASLVWEQKRFPFKVEVATHDIVMASLDRQLGQSLGFQWSSYTAAANYCLTNDTHLEKGIKWIDTGISFFGGNFQLFNTKANLLEKLDKPEEVEKLRMMAMNVGTVTDLFGYGQQLIGQKKVDQALKIFHQNEDRLKGMTLKDPMDEFFVYGGLAMGYNADEQKDKAIDYAKKALEIAPTPQTKGQAKAFLARLEQ